jgi:GAF domain-containing protein
MAEMRFRCAALFAGLDIDGRLGGVLAVLSARPVETWHVDVYLLMKLISASLSAALTRLKLGQRARRYPRARRT